MTKRSLLSLIVILLTLAGSARAQFAGAGCPNADFSMSNFTNWTGYYGNYGNPAASSGIAPLRHTIMTAPIIDPQTCGGLSVLPPGSNASARLGNDGTGSQAERLVYSITVDSSNALFIYKYAVVLQDPGHPANQQPKFEIRLLNSSGVQIGGNCGIYSVTAAAGLPGFVTCGSGTSQKRWKDWTSVGVNLMPWYGQTISIEFTTYDCAQSGHFGYAYIAADCEPLIIDVQYCPGDAAVQLVAPPGFATYSWNTNPPVLDDTLALNNPNIGDTVSVTMTSFTNTGSCAITLDAVIVPTIIEAGFEVNSPCEDLATFTDTSIVENGFIQSWFWDFGDGTTSMAQHPTHTFPSPGVYNVTLIAYSQPGQIGCTDTIIKPVTIFAKPDAGFSADIKCVGIASQFTDTSLANDPGGLVSWEWDFGGAGATPATSNLQNPSVVFSTPGIFNVKLVVTNSNGCKDSVLVPINSNSFPNLDFSFTNECAGTAASFTDLTVVNPPDSLNSWTWEMGDGNTYNTSSFTHTYTNGGYYNVELVVTSNDGCTDSVTKQVQIYHNPVSSFTAADECANDAVQFTDQSYALGSTITSWQWVFGDNTSGTTQHPTHTYTPGSYVVTLMTMSADSCTGVVTDTVNVYNYPVSSFTTNDICVNQTAQFTNTSQNPADGVISNFSWDFGDGSALNTVDVNPSHNYSAPGTYTVSLINYSSNLSCPDTFSQQITVHPMAQANFNFNDTCFNKTTFFTDASLGQLATWTWDFGDGTPLSSDTNTTHIFPGAGTYNVELLVTSIYGCADSVTQQVTVHPIPAPNFTGMNVCKDETNFFYDLSSVTNPYSIASQVWNFGDGATGTGATPQHQYADTGSYLVTLYAISDAGCVDSVKRFVDVHPFPEPSFTVSNPQGCRPVCVQFGNTSTIAGGDSISAINWIFGDGGDSQIDNPNYCYSNAGVYSVTLETESNYGCKTKVTYADTIRVFEYPVAEFTPDPSVTLITQPQITFVNGSDGASQYWWDFGDGQLVPYSSDENPTHSYITAGTFNVTLWVENDEGCRDSIDYTVLVQPEFTLYVPNAFTPDGNGLNDNFKAYGVGVDDFVMEIYDRWGTLVFRTDNIDIGWDGTFRGSEAQMDVYVYVIKATNSYSKSPYTKEGHVTLVR